VQAGLVHTHVDQEDAFIFVVQLGDLRLDGGANSHDGGMLRLGVLLHGSQVWIVLEAVFLDVGHVHAALGGDEAELLDQGQVVFIQVQRTHGSRFVQDGNDFFQQGHQLDALLVAGARGLLVALQGLLGGGQVGQGQFSINNFDVGYGVDAAGNVDHVFVFKAAHHMHDGVGFAYVGQELVAQTLALGRSGDQSGDVDELDHGGQDALRLDDLGQRRQ